MNTLKIILGFGLLASLISCGPSASDKAMAESKLAQDNKIADSVSQTLVSSSAAIENNKDSTRKFIRTAELRFKVKSVIKSTYSIEEIAGRQDGFVTYTNLSSTIDNVTTMPISADSSLETTYYTVTNSISLRVPNTKLDTTLKEISKNIEYLDYRIIKAEDVALQLLSNRLAQNRLSKSEKRLTNAIDNRGKKLKETTTAEYLLAENQERADNASISTLSLNDQVHFSTINLSIYQRQSLKRELIPNDLNIAAYEPGFGKKMLESLMIGWSVLEAIFVFLTKLWGLILIIVVAFLIFKFVERRLKK